MHHLPTRSRHVPRSPTARPPIRRAFSIPELLLIVGVLLVLGAIFFPLLTRTRHTTFEVAQTNAARQNAAAIIQYCNRSNGYFPFIPNGISAVSGDWYTLVYQGTDLSTRIEKYRARSFGMAMCLALDYQLMRPGYTVPSAQLFAQLTPISLAEVTHPSRKGMLYQQRIDDGPVVGPWCCLTDEIVVPVAFVDLSVQRGRWWDFLPDNKYYSENGVGSPINFTWYGAQGRDR